MDIIYRQVEIVVAVQTSPYTAYRALHGEASFPSPELNREWQVDYVSLQILASTGSPDFTLLFYRGVTGIGINEAQFPVAMVDLGGLRVDGIVLIISSLSITNTGSARRVYSVTPPRRVSISRDGGVYKFQTFMSGAITPIVATAKFVIGLVSSG